MKFGDLLTIELDNESYDWIFCINAIYFWDDLNSVFKKIYTMLNEDGVYCIYMRDKKELEKLKFANDFCKYSMESKV